MKLSNLARGIQTSPILTLAAEINAKIAAGEKFYNLTVGDFNPNYFPIPAELRDGIIAAYEDNQTNYPGALGLPHLRKAISGFLQHYAGVEYSPEDIFIGSGGRPFLYAAYLAAVDPGDHVIFPVPSWNNDYYTYLSSCKPIMLETTAETNFMPTAEMIEPHLGKANLLSLCSPLNPTGTVLNREELKRICEMVVEENSRRDSDRKPLYVIFDQMYWLLTFGDTEHHHAVKLVPEMQEYSIYVDGVSKAFCGTGVRLGWGYGPGHIVKKMRSIVAHMGAWAPRAEQFAAGHYLADFAAVDRYLNEVRRQIHGRLQGFYEGFSQLREKGYPVRAIEPQAAMYLTVELDLVGKKTDDGVELQNSSEVHRYVLDEAKVGLVPFSYFGASEDSNWYRLSVGTCRLAEVPEIIASLEKALAKLTD